MRHGHRHICRRASLLDELLFGQYNVMHMLHNAGHKHHADERWVKMLAAQFALHRLRR